MSAAEFGFLIVFLGSMPLIHPARWVHPHSKRMSALHVSSGLFFVPYMYRILLNIVFRSLRCLGFISFASISHTVLYSVSILTCKRNLVAKWFFVLIHVIIMFVKLL
jgi:hypothetical protein